MSSFKEAIQRLSMQIIDRKNYIANEETTKHSLIIPFVNTLGYDIFNPLEVRPEYVADFGQKKGEKVDYAIFKNNNPIMFLEAKSITERLENHDAQLSRYFNSSPHVKIAILTNGLKYKFFTDLNQNNVMDTNPFLEFDITNLKDSDFEILSSFRKEVFDSETIVKLAEELVYMEAINKTLGELFKNPSDEFIRFLIKDVSESRITANVLERFRPIVKKCIQVTLLEILSKGILKEDTCDCPAPASTISEVAAAKELPSEDAVSKRVVATTEDELKAYEIIVGFLTEAGKDTSQIMYKDTTNYLSVNYKNTNGWFIRLNVNSQTKYIGSRLPLETTVALSEGFSTEPAPKSYTGSKIIINSCDDIFKLKDFVVKSFEFVAEANH